MSLTSGMQELRAARKIVNAGRSSALVSTGMHNSKENLLLFLSNLPSTCNCEDAVLQNLEGQVGHVLALVLLALQEFPEWPA